MKAKKTFVVLVVVLLTMLFFVSASNASQWYYNMNVVKIGVSPDGYSLKVQNDAGTVTITQFLDPTDDKTLLAVVLTAQSLSSKIHVYLNTSTYYITGVVISNE